MKNIYLAGPISSIGDWRERIFPALKEKKAPVELGGFRCVGPFWSDRSTPTPHGGVVGELFRDIWQRNNAALAAADMVFEWIRGNACYGTITEIVEASKHGILVALAFGSNTAADEHWYVQQYAQRLLIPRRVHADDLPVVFKDALHKTAWRAR